MTAKAVTDGQLGSLSRKWREVQTRLETGVIPYPEVDQALQVFLDRPDSRRCAISGDWRDPIIKNERRAHQHRRGKIIISCCRGSDSAICDEGRI